MTIGVISDIHDHLENLKKAIEVFNQKEVSLVCFCGDLVSSPTISYFANLKAPVKSVFGNMDRERPEILEKIKKEKLLIDYPKEETFWEFEFGGKKIAIFHGHYEEVVNELLYQKNFDFVFTGHTHNFQIKKIKNTLWINPGTVAGWTGLDFQPVRPTVAIANIKALKGEIIYL